MLNSSPPLEPLKSPLGAVLSPPTSQSHDLSLDRKIDAFNTHRQPNLHATRLAAARATHKTKGCMNAKQKNGKETTASTPYHDVNVLRHRGPHRKTKHLRVTKGPETPRHSLRGSTRHARNEWLKLCTSLSNVHMPSACRRILFSIFSGGTRHTRNRSTKIVIAGPGA